MADDEFHAVRRKIISNRNALFGIAYVVADHRRELLAENAAQFVDVGDCLLGAFLDLRGRLHSVR